MYDHLQGAREQYIVQLLIWITLMYVRCVFVQYAAVCHCRRFVCGSGAAVRVRSGRRTTYGRILHKHTKNVHQRNST